MIARRQRASPALWCITLCAPSLSQAHVDIKTIQLLAGTIHPWINANSALALLVVVLWLCQHVQSTDLTPFILISGGLTVGDAVGILVAASTDPLPIEILTLALALAVATAYLPARRLWLMVMTYTAVLGGWYAGCDAARDVTAPTLFLVGVLTGGFAIPLAAGVVLVDRRSTLLRTSLRVLGSWIAAINLILVALRFRA